jgi:hypothetical protein
LLNRCSNQITPTDGSAGALLHIGREFVESDEHLRLQIHFKPRKILANR